MKKKSFNYTFSMLLILEMDLYYQQSLLAEEVDEVNI